MFLDIIVILLPHAICEGLLYYYIYNPQLLPLTNLAMSQDILSPAQSTNTVEVAVFRYILIKETILV